MISLKNKISKLYIIFLIGGLFLISGISSAATYYSKATGAWGVAGTWGTACGTGTGAIPTAADNVIICAGHIITMNVNGAQCLSLTINGTTQWANARTTNVGAGGLFINGGTITGTATGTLNVTGNFTATGGTNNIGRCNLNITGTTTVNNGVIVNLNNATGTKIFGGLIVTGTFNNAVNIAITINGNLQNDGTYTVGSGQVTFMGASSNTITGISTTAFNLMSINKGVSSANILDVQSLITLTAGGLTMTNGTLKLSNSSIIISPFIADITAAPYLIPSTAGLWCNGATVNSGNINWSVAGLLRISSGTINLGNTADNRFRAVNAGTTQLIIEGGILNVAGRISRAVATDYIAFTMSGGIINVPTVGSTAAGIAPIMMDQAGSSFTMSSGTIVIRRAGVGNLGFTATAGTVGITGGTIQFGDALTPAAQTMQMNCTFSLAYLSVNSANATCQLATNLAVMQGINISSGTLSANNLNISLGNSWTNAGTFIPGTGTVTLNGTGTQTITKSTGETFNNLTINKPSGAVTLTNNIQVNSTLNMTSGNIDCGANTLTLGISTVSTGTLTYTNGSIIGNFKRWINATGVGILFPVGVSAYYRSALLTFTNIVGGTLTAGFISSDPGSNGLPVSESGKSIANQYTEGFWDFTAANGLASTNYAIELTGNGFTSYSVSSSTRLLYRSTSGSPWSLNGTHVAGSGYIAKRTAVNGLSAQFGFGKPSCSLFSAVSVAGSSSVCTNTTGELYSVTDTPGNTYTWVITGGSVASGQGTASITVDWGAVGMAGSVQVTEQNDCGDNNTPVNLAVYIHPITTSVISGSTSVSTNESGVVYSVTNTPGYTYTWSFPGGGGAIAGGQGTNAVTVNWGAVAGPYTLRVDVTRLCAGTDFQTLPITVRGPIQSNASGSWATGGTWIGGIVPTATDYVEIQAGHTITMNGNSGACYNLTINGTANWTQARTTNVGAGGIVINSTGDIAGAGAGILTTTGGISGINNANITSTTVTITVQTTTGQNINSNGAFNRLTINANATNTGTITIANGGTFAGSATLTQSNVSTLTMNGTTFSLTTLNASASGNTVVYGANAAQIIKTTTYHNLTLSGTNTKTLAGAIVVNGDLNISGVTFDISTSNFALTVNGNWINTGSFVERFGTVTFNGSETQTITNATGETFNNLNMTGAGSKILAGNVTINFDFSLNSAVDAGNNDINIMGNWDNSGSYSALTNNDVTFNNNTTISGTSVTPFRNVVITGILTAHPTNMNISGNFTNNGTFNNNNGTVTFDGTSILSGTSTTTFKNLDISGTVTAPAGNTNIAGNFANNGTFSHNSGTVTLTGTTAFSGTSVTGFNNLTISGTATAPSGNMNVAGNFTNNGTFTHNNGTITFNGTSNISGTFPVAFYNASVAGTTTTSVNTSFGNDLSIASGTFSIGASNISVTGNTSIDGMLAFTSATGTKTFGNLNVNTTGTLNNNGNANVTVNGNLLTDGAITPGSGTYTFAGTSKTLTGTNGFANVNGVITGTYTYDCATNSSFGTLTVGNQLTIVTDRGLNINTSYTNNGITLVDASPNGHSGSLITPAAITNTGTCSFKSSIAKNKWHCISSSVTNAQIETVFSDLASHNNNFYRYDETSAGGYWVQQTTGTMNPGQGYYMYYFSNKYKTHSGTYNSGPVNVPLTYSASGRLGWNFVGNPYPSAIDWDAAGWTKTNIEDAVYIKNGPAWETYVGGVGSCRYIYQGQGFFVKALSGGGSLGFSTSVQLHRNADNLKNMDEANAVSDPILQLSVSNDSMLNNVYLRFKDNATSNFDISWDAYKIFSEINSYPEAFFLTTSNDTLSINSTPFTGNDTIIPLGVKIGVQGTYKIKAEQILNFDPSIDIFIEDAQTSIWTNLKEEANYSFASGPCRDINRFFLHFFRLSTEVQKNPYERSLSLTNPYDCGNRICFVLHNFLKSDVTIELVDINGKVLYHETNRMNNTSQFISIDHSSFNSGYYFLNVFNPADRIVKKVCLIK